MEILRIFDENEKTLIDCSLGELRLKRTKEVKEAIKYKNFILAAQLKDQIKEIEILSDRVSRIQF